MSKPDRPETEEHRGHHHDHHHHGHRHDGQDGSEHAHDSHVHDGHAVGASRDPLAHRTDLARGSATGKVIWLDPFSGIAGDMSIAALLDLGVPFSVIEEAVAALSLPGVELVVEAVDAGAIGACRFDVRVREDQPERPFSAIDELLGKAALRASVRALSRAIFKTLAEAESEVHRVPIERVCFHEVGAVDAIVDVVAAAACFEHLGARVRSAPLPMGRGFVDSRHGVLPLPAPATVLCLRGVPTYDAGIQGELVTPTGAAIVRTVASAFEAWPDLAPERVGWGAGHRLLPDRPNALRVVLGEPCARGDDASRRTHVVLEANVDDMTGELAGHTIERLFESGALDAWVAPLTMKKGRPGFLVSALAEVGAAERIVESMLRETTTLGVRRTEVSRTVRPRRSVTVQTDYGPIAVKISDGPFGPAQVKPEFADCARAARAAAVPVREVIDAARRAAEEPARPKSDG